MKICRVNYNIARLVCILLFVPTMLPQLALAEQQKWAAQYLQWSFDSNPAEVYNIDQTVWIPQPNSKSFWPVHWSWRNGNGVGGYLGLLQESASEQIVRFSLWNAVQAEGSRCRTFGGEGVGYTCVLSVAIDPTKYYRLRLWKTAAEADGQWWGGWLIEVDDSGRLTDHFIGQIKVAPQYVSVDPNSISNFVEFFGGRVNACREIPASIVGFAAPSLNYRGSGTGKYGALGSFKAGTRPAGNICRTGNENQGALGTTQPQNFGFAQGAMMYLGGADPSDSRFPVGIQSLPDPLPDS